MSKNNILGNRIKSRRQTLNLSQSELAKRLNCTQAALSQYENGNREPGLKDLSNIAHCLQTTTDYLLGLTDIASTDGTTKVIGDYLGFTEESIEKLHKCFLNVKSKTSEEELQKEAKFLSGRVSGEEGYENDYNYVKTNAILDLEDYIKTINEFICSKEFSAFLRSMKHNLFLERNTYDVLRMIAKRYDDIETPVLNADILDMMCSFSEDSEHNIRNYSLNLFDAQNALIDFCRNFTTLEEIKRLEYDESFYRKMHFYLYMCGHPENGNTSDEPMEQKLYPIIEPYISTITKLLERIN